jgi:pimeloyl-ACP methyl ester carboxylesterase
MRRWFWQCAMPDLRLQTVRSPDGLDLAVYETGNPDGPPILFLHGFSQSALCWQGQLQDDALAAQFRLVAYDIRGHGASGQPLDPAAYADDRLFADDTAAVIAALRLHRPVLVGWSYAGRLIGDYLRNHGAGGLAGINYVCARTNSDPAFNGPGNQHLRAMCRGDLGAEIAATLAFLSACFHQPPPPEVMARALAYTMRVPPAVRGAHLTRPADDGAILAQIPCPVLITQGAEDQLVLPGMAAVTAAAVPGAELSLYAEIGHAPFVEDRARFNRELAAFTLRCQTGRSAFSVA